MLDHPAQCRVGQLNEFRLQAMLLQLAWHQVPARDLELLGRGVAGQFNDFEPNASSDTAVA